MIRWLKQRLCKHDYVKKISCMYVSIKVADDGEAEITHAPVIDNRICLKCLKEKDDE